jgi:hypothetical protein
MKRCSRQLLTLLRTFNLGSLKFLQNPLLWSEYLRGVHKIYLSLSFHPVKNVSLGEIVDRDQDVEVFLPVGFIKPGSTPLADLAALAVLVKKKRPQKIFEIGTFEGLSSVVFAKNSEPQAKIYTLDLPPLREVLRTRLSYETQSVKGHYDSGCLIEALESKHQIVRLYGDSALYDFTLHENSTDLFFIDGAHAAAYVLRDSLNAFLSIKEGGWVIWHDCFVPDVFRVLKTIGRYHSLLQIEGTTLALSMGKPGPAFPWEIFENRIV